MHRLLCSWALALGGSALFLLSGCSGSAPTQFYLLPSLAGTETPPRSAADTRDLTIGVGPVILPPYLDRTQIVTRASRAKLTLAEFDQWAAPLQGTMARVLAEDLSLLIPTDRVLLHPWPRTIELDYQVTVEVIQFDRGTGNEVILAARWSLLDRDGKELAMRKSLIRMATGTQDYEAIVTTMGRTLEVLSRDIATTLLSLAQQAPRR